MRHKPGILPFTGETILTKDRRKIRFVSLGALRQCENRTARLQDLTLFFAQPEGERIQRIGKVLETLGLGTYLIGTGPYTQGVYSAMADEVILGRLATPLEQPLDKPVDIFCHDVPCLMPREVSRYHAMIYRVGDASKTSIVKDLGCTCGTFVRFCDRRAPD